MKKRLLAGLLSLFMALSLFSATALAAENPPEGQEEQAVSCTCTVPCTKEQRDTTCPVCAEDDTKCESKAEPATEDNMIDNPVQMTGSGDNGSAIPENGEISTAAQLQAALTNPAGEADKPTIYKLTQDIELTNENCGDVKITATDGNYYIVLDLNGHTIQFNLSSRNPYNCGNANVHLTIQDTSENKTGKITDEGASFRANRSIFQMDKGDVLNLAGGTIELSKSGGADNVAGGAVHISGAAVI